MALKDTLQRTEQLSIIIEEIFDLAIVFFGQ